MKFIKYFLLVIILGLTICVLLLELIGINQYKNQITQLVSQALGREVQIKGDIDIDLFPSPNVDIQKITISGVDTSTPLLTTEHLEVSISLAAILNGHIALKNLSLSGIELNLIKDQHGNENWQFTDNTSSETNTDTDLSSLFNQQLSIDVLDATIHYQDINNKITETLSIKEFTLFAKTLKTHISIDAHYLELPIKLKAQTTDLITLSQQENWPLTLDGTVGNISLKLEGNANIPDLSQTQFNIQSSFDDLSTIATLTQQTLPNIKNVTLNTQITANKKSLTVSQLQSAIGDTTLSGKTTYLFGKTPKLIADLNIESLDLTPLASQANTKKTTKTKDNHSIFSTEPLPLSILKKWEADVKLNIKKLSYKHFRDLDSQLTATLENGKLDISRFDVITAYKEKIHSKLTLNTQEKEPSLSFAIDGDAIALEKNKVLSQYITGATTELDANLNSKGNSVKKLMAQLNGVVTVKVSPGTISSDLLNFIGSNILLDLTQAINPLSDKTTQSNLECAAIRLDISDGIATINKGIAFQTDTIQVVSSGEIDFNQETLDFAIKPRAREGIELNLNDLAGAVKLAGTLQQPHIVPDLTGTALIATYVSTGGTAFLAKSLLNTALRDADPCKTALLSPSQKKDTKPVKKIFNTAEQEIEPELELLDL